MDNEVSKRFDRQDHTLERIDGKLDAIRADASDHLERIAKVEEKAVAAHRRMDEFAANFAATHSGSKTRSGMGWKEWLALFLAGGAGIGAAIKAFLFSDKP